MEKANQGLFGDLNDFTLWAKEWKDMPEFIQEKQKPYSVIIVRCATKEDLAEFSKLMKQKLNKETKSIWYPFKSHWGNSPKVKYSDEP